ncbi:hypothetical protein D9611_008343 [Ephemerocybe angulata]|uniref:Ankyrin n=1 Tax=Ephemerocybe angulata TaxID=980116 RepID=A0A8H5F563_9AGAR|nr:hypothetical protein D9611_008343 [Tulosesus angulatus]
MRYFRGGRLIRRLQKFIARLWSAFPSILGLAFLLSINLVFIIDIELTLRRNASLREQDEFPWGFGQTLAIIPLLMPLRDIAEALLARRMQKALNLRLESAVKQKQWDAVLAFVARGADPNTDMRGETTAIREACFSDTALGVVRALLDAGADPNIDPGPRRDTNTIRRENKDCLQLLMNYENGFLDGASALSGMTVKGYGAGVMLLLAKPGIEVNAADTDGRTPLHVAAAKGHEVILKHLLAAPGIDVNAPDTNGWTALTWASFRGNETIVKDLCAVPEIIVDVADIKRRLEHPPEGEMWKDPASKDEQGECIRVLEEFVELKRGSTQEETPDGEQRGGL